LPRFQTSSCGTNSLAHLARETLILSVNRARSSPPPPSRKTPAAGSHQRRGPGSMAVRSPGENPPDRAASADRPGAHRMIGRQFDQPVGIKEAEAGSGSGPRPRLSQKTLGGSVMSEPAGGPATALLLRRRARVSSINGAFGREFPRRSSGGDGLGIAAKGDAVLGGRRSADRAARPGRAGRITCA